MTRQEHVEWCKRRALAYLPADPQQAVTSMLSDMREHDETRHLIEGPFGMIGLMELMNCTPGSARRFIDGFN